MKISPPETVKCTKKVWFIKYFSLINKNKNNFPLKILTHVIYSQYSISTISHEQNAHYNSKNSNNITTHLKIKAEKIIHDCHLLKFLLILLSNFNKLSQWTDKIHASVWRLTNLIFNKLITQFDNLFDDKIAKIS